MDNLKEEYERGLRACGKILEDASGLEKDNSKNKFTLLKEASQPLIDFLNRYYDPMTIAIVRGDRVDIFRSEMGMPLEVRD